MDYIAKLKEAIWKLHGLEAEHLETVPITETFQGQIAWQGEVEVFSIRGHPKAVRCYAWAHVSGDDDERTRYVAVLELPPVDSAQNAVKAALVDEIRNNAKKGN